MRKLLLSATALTVLFLASCKKNDDDGDGGGVTPGTRLSKVVVKSGADSTVTNYAYNSAGKLNSVIVSGASQGQPINAKTTIVRNSSGIITKEIIKSDAFAGLIDSLVTNIGYDGANSRYKNAVTSVSIFGFNITDSIVYNYDGSGKLTSQVDYINDGTGYVIDNKVEYVYSGSNLQSQKFYTYDPSTSSYTLDESNTYEFDGKTNPVQFANEAPVLGMTQFFSANNATKDTYVSVSAPANNYVNSITYTYNDVNRPLTAVQVQGSTTSNATFTY